MFLKLDITIKVVLILYMTLYITTKIAQIKLMKLRYYNENSNIIILESKKGKTKVCSQNNLIMYFMY